MGKYGCAKVRVYPVECGEQLGRDPSKIGSSKSLVLKSSSGEGTHWDSSSSIEPLKRFDRTPKKVLSNPKGFYRTPFRPPKRFHRSAVKRFSEPQKRFYRTFGIEPPLWGYPFKTFPKSPLRFGIRLYFLLRWHVCRVNFARKIFFEPRIFLRKMLRNFPRNFWAFVLWVRKNPRKNPSKFPTKFSKFPCEK